MNRKYLFFGLAIALVLVVVGYAIFDLLIVDDCLDAGGRWLWSEMSCEGARADE